MVIAQDTATYLRTIYGDRPGAIQPGDYVARLARHVACERLGYTGGESPSAAFLDVGCGKGLQAAAFTPYFDVAGIDISDDCLSYFQEQNLPVTFKPCDLENESFPFPDNSFDVVFSKSVLEHVRQTRHFLGEIQRVVRPGGQVVLMVPAWETQHAHYFDDPTHVSPYTEIGLRRTLEMTGFADPSCEQFYQMPLSWRVPAMKPLYRLVALLPDELKWRDRAKRTPRKWVRFAKETMLFGHARVA